MMTNNGRSKKYTNFYGYPNGYHGWHGVKGGGRVLEVLDFNFSIVVELKCSIYIKNKKNIYIYIHHLNSKMTYSAYKQFLIKNHAKTYSIM